MDWMCAPCEIATQSKCRTKQSFNIPSSVSPVLRIRGERWARLSVAAPASPVIGSMHAGRESPASQPASQSTSQLGASASLKPHLSEGFIPPCRLWGRVSTLVRLHRLSCCTSSPAWRLAASPERLFALFRCHENKLLSSNVKSRSKVTSQNAFGDNADSPWLERAVTQQPSLGFHRCLCGLMPCSNSWGIRGKQAEGSFFWVSITSCCYL